MSRSKLAPRFDPREVYEAVASSSLTLAQAAILQVFGWERDPETGVINGGHPDTWLDVTSIGRKARVVRRTVQLALKELRAMGIVVDVPKAEMPRGARRTYRLVQGWFRLDLSKIPRQEEEPATCEPGSQVDDEPCPEDPATCEPGSQVVCPPGLQPAIVDPPQVIVDRGTCDRRSQPLGSDLSIIDLDRSIDDRPDTDALVREALDVATAVAKAEELHPLDATDRKRITELVTAGALKPDHLRSIGVWMHNHDLLEEELRRSKGRKPFWRGHRRHWTTLLKNPDEVEKRIAEGLRIECNRAPVVELPMRDEPDPNGMAEPERHEPAMEPEPQLAECPAVEVVGVWQPPRPPDTPVVVPERLRRIREQAEARAKVTTSGR